MRLFRLVKIISVSLKYGLDQMILSNEPTGRLAWLSRRRHFDEPAGAAACCCGMAAAMLAPIERCWRASRFSLAR